MDEQEQKLLKELLQKKLHGTLTSDEEMVLNDLAAKKSGRKVSSSPSSALASGLSALDNLMSSTDSLNNTLDEMSGKIGMRSHQAEAKQALAEADKEQKEKKKGWFNW
jgi:hypothetical protein